MAARRPRQKPNPDAAAEGQEPLAPTLRPIKPYALWLLGRREWSAKELEQRLKFKGYSASDIEECLAFCQRHGLQSDERFAASKVRSRATSHGNRRIRQELSQKGVAEAASSQALEEAGDEAERAVSAARRFEGKPWSLDLKGKAWRFLMSRGFGSDAIKTALRGLQERAPGSTAGEDEEDFSV